MMLALCAADAAADLAFCVVELPSGEAPERIVLMRQGELNARDGRRWRLTDPGAVVAATRARAGEVELPIDYEHQTQRAPENGQPAPAAGWVREVRVEGDAIVARVEWTERARKMIMAREYRYFSPAFHHRKDGTVTAIVGGGLTNAPALDLPALATDAKDEDVTMNEQIKRLLQKLGLAADADKAAVDAAIEKVDGGESATTALASVREALGLAADAGGAAVATAVKALTSTRQQVAEALGLAADADTGKVVAAAKAKQPDPGAFVPRSEFDVVASSLQTLQGERTEELATAAVDAAISSGRVTPAQRDWALGYARSDGAGFKKFIEAQPVIVAAGARAGRSGAPDPDAALTSDELAVCRQLGIEPVAFKAARKVDIEAGEEVAP